MFATYLYSDRKKHIIVRRESLDGHTIETRIAITPPTGHGQGGAVPTVSLEVFIDRVKRVSCPLGWGFQKDVIVPNVVIHTADNSIQAFHGKPYTCEIWSFKFKHSLPALIVAENGKLVTKQRKDIQVE